ncbi:MAG: hypothetical protein ACLPPF_06875 [Rhodomicrobium sp.]
MSEKTVKPPTRRGMVNAAMVNGEISHFLPAAFRGFFADLGRIPRFKKSIKYNFSAGVNTGEHETAAGRRLASQQIAGNINILWRRAIR